MEALAIGKLLPIFAASSKWDSKRVSGVESLMDQNVEM